jgi:RNA polymerase-binding transcription factor DksA
MSNTPLTETQQAALSARLDARERELQAEVRAVNEEAADTPTREPHLQVGDIGEQGEERIRDAVRYAEKERDIQELRQIADARDRLRDGSYGLCIDCGTAIPFARLEALPFSERCVPCQEAYEATHTTGVRIPMAP